MSKDGDNPQSILISYLVGLGLLVFIAVTFSLVFDGSITPDRDEANLRDRIDRESDHKEALELEKNKLLAEWNHRLLPLLSQEAELADVRSVAEKRKIQKLDLTRRKEQLQITIHEIPLLLVEHRDVYRKEVRNRLTHEKFDSLELSSGKRYTEVTIREFDESSLQITHAGGAARIAMVELPEDWKAKIHWGSDEVSGISSPLK